MSQKLLLVCTPPFCDLWFRESETFYFWVSISEPSFGLCSVISILINQKLFTSLFLSLNLILVCALWFAIWLIRNFLLLCVPVSEPYFGLHSVICDLINQKLFTFVFLSLNLIFVCALWFAIWSNRYFLLLCSCF